MSVPEQFPEDLNAPFSALFSDFRDLWPDGGFELHLAVIAVLTKSGLCTQIELDEFNHELASCSMDPSAVEYIRTVASIGRFAVHGPREGQRTAVLWLREHYPSDELLEYPFCNE